MCLGKVVQQSEESPKVSLPYGSVKPLCYVTGQRSIATTTPASDLLQISALSAIEVSFVGRDCSALKSYQICCHFNELVEGRYQRPTQTGDSAS